MARIVKERTARRNDILDVAQRLVYEQGYEQMAIQEVLDALHISKGSFYHYFDSKQALLEALIGRMLDQIEQVVVPIVDDTRPGALDKLQRFIDAIGRWKNEQKSYLVGLMRVWFADDNAIVRQKLLATSLQRVTPWFTSIIRQGIHEGVLSPAYPDQVGEMVLVLLEGMANSLAKALVSPDLSIADLPCLENIVAAYTDALERVLGAPAKSLQMADSATLRDWIEAVRASG
jgi:AcrR family transcriptional regulator